MSNNIIIQELLELKSPLADLLSLPTYAVPEGFFDGFASQVLARIKALELLDEKEDEISLTQNFTNPDTELSVLAPLLSTIGKQNLYSVPQSYFDRLEEKVLTAIYQQQQFQSAGEELSSISPLLSTIGKQNPYTVSQDYFNGLEEEIMSAIYEQEDFENAGEELSSLSPLLSSIGKSNPYTVPQGYFEALGNTTSSNNVAKSPAKVVSMVNRKWFRYAAAAIVMGFIALTGIQYFNSNPGTVSNPHAWVEKNMNKVSTDDMDNFIQIADEASVDPNNIATSAKSDIKDLMKDVSDKDIQDFLNKSSGSDDNDGDILLN